MKKKKALITGITGQDGSYLSELLLDKGYEVYGMYRRVSVDDYFGRIDHLKGKIKLVCGELTDLGSLDKVIREVKPDEIYNLAAQSQVRVSFDQPNYTKEVNRFGVERLLDCIKKYVPYAKFYQASTSEMFGKVKTTPQNEDTPFDPQSPYAEAKLEAHKVVQRAREEWGLFGCCGILFNHESERRGLEFVTRKFTDGIVRIKLGLKVEGKKYLEMGNLEAERDWGYAGDYVKAMYLMMQQNEPDDYVIATGENHTVRKFIETAAKHLDINITWKGKGLKEKGYYGKKKIITINKKHFRDKEVHTLLGDPTKARKKLKWEPKVRFEQLIELMVMADYARLKDQKV